MLRIWEHYARDNNSMFNVSEGESIYVQQREDHVHTT